MIETCGIVRSSIDRPRRVLYMFGTMSRSSLVCLLLLLGAVYSAHAQVNTSAIAGAVTDETGSVIANATISVLQVETGLERQTATGENGEYVVPQLSPGSYQITVKKTGFQTGVVKNVVLAIAQREVVNI